MGFSELSKLVVCTHECLKRARSHQAKCGFARPLSWVDAFTSRLKSWGFRARFASLHVLGVLHVIGERHVIGGKSEVRTRASSTSNRVVTSSMAMAIIGRPGRSVSASSSFVSMG